MVSIGNLKRWYPRYFKKWNEKGKIDLQTAINEAESRKLSPPDNHLDQEAKSYPSKSFDNVNVNDNVNDSDNVIRIDIGNLLPSGNGNKSSDDKKNMMNWYSSFEKLTGKKFTERCVDSSNLKSRLY